MIVNIISDQLTEAELRQYRRDIQDWTVEQIQDELLKLYVELTAGVLPQAAYQQAKQVLETQLYGKMHDTSDADYERAMKGI